MDAAAARDSDKPRLLFVDDEQRVLNSMRIMFRRQFDLYLASHGREALEIVNSHDIDVIVADHRMPQMTGVEVLSRVRGLSPRTVRILLTGYADLDAVEGSINDGEVFRFLTKPCAPGQLKETIDHAVRLARTVPIGAADDGDEDLVASVLESEAHRHDADADANGGAPPQTAPSDVDRAFTGTDVIERPPVLAAAPPEQPQAAAAEPELPKERPAGVGIIIFSADQEVVDTVQKAVRGRVPVYTAGNIVQVVKLLTEHRPGVLVTDISTDKATIQSMTARLKEHLPQLVTIAVSQHRDVLDMVWLINHGQIFRFLRKPLSAGRCAISLQAALQHHRTLLKNPELVKRHEVAASADDDSGVMDGVLSKLRSVRRLWASA